tara:strand:+ start:133 stop:1029 length:897 start_codon:yes stop_codon:yes gene_type:complete
MHNIKNIVKENIADFNKHQKNCEQKLEKFFPDVEIKYEIKKQLDKNIRKLSSSSTLTGKAMEQLKLKGYVKNSVETIANNFFVRKNDMKKLLTRQVFKKLENKTNLEDIKNSMILHLSADGEDQFQGFRFIKDNLNKDIDQFLPYILRDGFDQDYSGLEIGTNSSNEGDGAEHLFVAKAMIAGFNCSVVDIGSSKYDAVIEDKNGDLLKVQIKSYGKNGSFSRKGRDRGGQGIDSSNKSNEGTLVTSQNCDILAAVNKSNGEIFIFCKDEIDNLPVTIKRSDYPENWENWAKINESVN